jgi:hypothetical protein
MMRPARRGCPTGLLRTADDDAIAADLLTLWPAGANERPVLERYPRLSDDVFVGENLDRSLR